VSYNGNGPRAVPNPPAGGTASIMPLVLLALAGLVVAVAWSSVFSINEMQQAIVTQFGRPVGEPIAEPGVHFKLPLVQDVHYIEKRVLEWDGRPNQIPTRDKKYIWVDTTARWRITDPLKYLQSVGTESSAQGRLDDIIDSATRDVVSRNHLVEIVRDTNRIFDTYTATVTEEGEEESAKVSHINAGRSTLQEAIEEKAAEVAPQYGIALVDVKVKRINYEKSVRQKVFDRMISERLKIAEKIRAEGAEKKAEIEGTTERELRRIRSEAYQQSEAVKGSADAEATRIYASAYEKGADLYRLLKSLETYKKTLADDSVLILSTDNEYLKHLSTSR